MCSRIARCAAGISARAAMNSRPGRLTGNGIRPLPDALRRKIIRDVKEDTGKGRRLTSARYRVTGYRNGAGAWVTRDPRTGKYWVRGPKGGKRPVKVDGSMVAASAVVAVEVELDRGRGPRIYYTTVRLRGD
jgi:hypothetical protein